MGKAVQQKTGSRGTLALIQTVIILLVSMPFWASAAKLGWETQHFTARGIVWVQMWEASVFSLGIAVGLMGTALALGTTRKHYRGLGLALVLLGTSSISFAFVMARLFHRQSMGTDGHALPLAIPGLLLVCSLGVFLITLRAPLDDAPQSDPTSEEPPPLSQP